MATPTDKSESEKLRVPVSSWMLGMAALAFISYAGVFAMLLLGKGAAPEPPPPQLGGIVAVQPPEFHKQSRPLLLMIAGAFALLGICEPFARDLVKVVREDSLRSHGRPQRPY